MTKIMNSFKLSTRFFVEVTGFIVAMVIVCLPVISHAAVLTRQLDIGMTGSDVTALQTYLAQDTSIYPQGLVTGYFGTLTSTAVSNFQTKNGISPAGRVGPITLIALNNVMSGGISSSVGAPMIYAVSVGTNRNNVTVNWSTNENASGVVYYSTSPLTTYENTNSVNVSGATAMTDAGFRVSQNVGISGLQANTTYYYLIYTTDQQGNVSVTWPSTFQTTN